MKKRLIKMIKWLLISVLLYIAFFESFIFINKMIKPKSDVDYVIVLGASAWHNAPSPSFKIRLNKAYEYLVENPETKVIVTGGFGDGAEYSEGEVGAKYLENLGIDSSRILYEENSRTTFANLAEAFKLVGKNHRFLVVTDDYHSLRAQVIALKQGVKLSVYSSDARYHIVRMRVREYLALIKAIVWDW